MGKKNIAIVAGGDSSEFDISLNGAKFYTTILDSEKYNLDIIVISKANGWYTEIDNQKYFIDKNDFSFTKDGVKRNFDLAVIIIHGTPGENGLMQSYFDLVGIPYATGNHVSSTVSFDKEFSKNIVQCHGIKTPMGVTIYKGDKYCKEDIAKLGFPLFIKPNASGSSFGVTKVKSVEEIDKAIEYAFTEDEIVLVEKAVFGREISCGAYSLGGEIFTLPPTEIVTTRDFFDYEAKYLGESQEITPADFPEDIMEKVNEITKKIYKVMRCRSVVRIDYIIQDGDPYMIEINNIPGMSAASIIPQQVKAKSMNIGELYDNIISEFIK